ncbi:hypothetical protein M8J77_001636 [Diaphorina citri]|nr:hypothetical protein M8J77_001636 [Diaphorina citri]
MLSSRFGDVNLTVNALISDLSRLPNPNTERVDLVDFYSKLDSILRTFSTSHIHTNNPFAFKTVYDLLPNTLKIDLSKKYRNLTTEILHEVVREEAMRLEKLRLLGVSPLP